MNPTAVKQFSDRDWLESNIFSALKEVSELLAQGNNQGREALIRILEHRREFPAFEPIIAGLIQRAGLYPYLLNTDSLSTSELLNYEFHTVEGLDSMVLHAVQGQVYRALCDGANVILSAPTSFGKSLLIDAMIASSQFESVVVVVPTIALIDETRRRLSRQFGAKFKIITHPTQAVTERNIFVLTQERYIEFEDVIRPQFFVVDEFYKLSPSRDDERTFVLNHVFYKLLKTGAQFFLIGPNIQDVRVDQASLHFRYFQTDFSTVATEVEFSGGKHPTTEALSICRKISDPTLIFCKSARSAYQLAAYLRDRGVCEVTEETKKLAEWIQTNYHPDWVLAGLLKAGLGIHHGALPRSLAYHILRLFNEGKIRFLLCTSTIIEGVNTSAKNIIIYDNKIATTKFDQFTFNNIKGRPGRMFRHFVGHVYVLQEAPQPELPFVDIPSVTQPAGTPESLLVQIEEEDLSDRSKEQLKYLHAQDVLPMDVIRSNVGVQPYSQLVVAEVLMNDVVAMHRHLSWTGYPKLTQLRVVCQLIFDHLMEGKGTDGARSAKQLYFTISRFKRLRVLDLLIEDLLENDNQIADASSAVETLLKIQRNLIEFHFPRYLLILDKIQRSVFEKTGRQPGNYETFAADVRRLFLPISATLLEEYGLPHQVTMRIEQVSPLGDDVDTVLRKLRGVDPRAIGLTEFETDMFNDTIANL